MRKAVILSFVLIFAVSGCSLTGQQNMQKVIGLEEAKVLAVNFINNNLMQPGSQVSIKEATEEIGLYKITVNTVNGQEIATYLSKDGKKFFPQVMDIEEVEKQNEQKNAQEEATQAPTVADIPKSEKPKVELFVMSFCPYGVQAENIMAPVVELLGDKADINVRYIASVTGNDLDSVKSLHGVIEGKEDARQLCVARDYNSEVFWKYVLAINKDCYPVYRQGDEVYNDCWQKAAKNSGINTSELDACMASDGMKLINAEDEAAKKYGVTGSPTLIINGQRFNATRTSEGYKTAICNAFNNPPEECSKTLSSDSISASGDCE